MYGEPGPDGKWIKGIEDYLPNTQYLTAEHMDWCEDSTNQSADYTRNRIRSQVLPLLKTAVNEQAEEHILQAGQIIGQADAYLRQQAEEI
mgnify:CR=1 FL=1